MAFEMAHPLGSDAVLRRGRSNPHLRMEVAPGPQRVTVWLSGEIDLATRDDLRDLIAPFVAAGHHVILDLRGVTFLDSSGINLFVATHRQCRASGGQFALEAPSVVARSVLKVTGVDDALNVNLERQ